MATLYKSNGVIIEVEPKNGEKFQLKELYEMLGCDTVERVFIKGIKTIMVVDECGKLRRRPFNQNAINIYHSCERMNAWEWIAGDALVCENSQF